MEIFSTREEYENLISSEAYKKFEKFCIGIENINLLTFFYDFFNPLFTDPLEMLENTSFKKLFKNLEMYSYINRKEIFKKEETVVFKRKKNIKNYIEYCKNLIFKEEYENSVTYFITDGEYVKIGQSKKPKERLSIIQPYNPKKLTLLTIFEEISEAKAHSLFSTKHIKGEWYKFDLEVILKIEALKKNKNKNKKMLKRDTKLFLHFFKK